MGRSLVQHQGTRASFRSQGCAVSKLGDRLTEADWRLFTTLVRFDPVYVGHFKRNIRRLVDYPQLSAYLRDLYQYEGVAETVNMQHIKHHYYESHETLNPSGVVPVGPELELNEAHGRG